MAGAAPAARVIVREAQVVALLQLHVTAWQLNARGGVVCCAVVRAGALVAAIKHKDALAAIGAQMHKLIAVMRLARRRIVDGDEGRPSAPQIGAARAIKPQARPAFMIFRMVQHDAENWRAAVLAANSNNILAVVISVAIRNNMASLQVTRINTGSRRREGFGGGHVASLAQ